MRLPRNYGSIVKRKGNRKRPYMIRKRIEVNGVSKRVTIGWAETKAEAMEILAEANKNGVDMNRYNATVEDVFNLWLKYKAPMISNKLVRDNTSRFNKYFSDIKDRPFKSLRLSHYMDIINGSNLPTGGKENLKSFMRSLDEVAYNYDITNKKYSDNLPVFHTQTTRRTPFTPEEIDTLWCNVEIEDVDLVLMLIYTGFRSGEFCEIKLENIDTDKWIITGGKKTKAGTNRNVPVHPDIRNFLIGRMEKAKGDTLLNYSDKTLRIRFKKVMQALEMEHIPHECRHTLRTLLDNAGANRVCIDLILGHASGNVGQDVYTHKTIEQLHEAIKCL